MIRKRINLVSQARLLAIKKHANQLYSDGNPYIQHLEEVVTILDAFGYDDEKYKCAGYLHDIIEDTDTSYNNILNQFGLEIAEIVYCVTDELGRNRKERKEKTLPKIKSNQDAIIVKLADRIANLENSKSIKSDGEFLKMYRKENIIFKEQLFINEDHAPMWKYIDELLEENS